MAKQYLFDGAAIKSVSPWDDSDIGWVPFGGTRDPEGVDILAQRVPWMYRGVKDRANNVSHMPWAIMAGEDEIASSAEWSYEKPPELAFITNPRKLLSQIEQSLVMTGKAYLALECNKSGYIKAIKYLNPISVTERYSPTTGELIGYTRTVNGQRIECDLATSKPVAGRVQIVAVYDPDYTTEIGPGNYCDALAALTAAGVLYSYDTFVKQYFERGAIKATVLSVDAPAFGEQERLQKWWDDVVSGVKNAWSAIVLRGKAITPVVIGEGMEGIADNDLSTLRRQDISTALGIPESRLWSAAANMATRKEDEAAYFRGTILPECDIIAEAFNEQVFTDAHNLAGYRWEFQPETLDVFQEDEAQRASSLQQLTSAGIPLKLAMEILGYDLTEEQWAELEDTTQPEEAPAMPVPAAPDMTPATVAPEAPTLPAVVEDAPAPDTMVPSIDQTASIRAMLKNWERKAKHALKLTGCANIEWVTDLLPPGQIAEIAASLAVCETAEQIKAVFAGVTIEDAPEAPAPVDLAAELKRANDLLIAVMAR